ncbi:uncharacterized protein LOC133515139 [Syngnathoides biaculeatus]|uniref:uncharacterized protein LOC133515139 n=1 Tax=Syngnathoides biaculeatus TaxID=300417 RepID=UPI002ADDCF1B|nr:uncharacterized protein LOC133515139 [Syngnathoides biaculeatus]XP_061703440.1 uncharacterized protein LOC133515139 [Syngnathoides biaculeatus]XP_061703441.1 uncharacterized protein LOC133515139 [Syngnathoides biaculeatus]
MKSSIIPQAVGLDVPRDVLSEVKVRPVPSPRLKRNTNKCESRDILNPPPNNYPADYKRLSPVRPLPEPPTGIYVDDIHPKAAANETNPTSTTEPPSVYHRTLLAPPLPPPRPPLANISIRPTAAQRKSEDIYSDPPLAPQSSQPKTDNIGPQIATISGLHSSIISSKEPVYIEPDDALYLEILPPENNTMDTLDLIKWMRKVSRMDHMAPSLYGLTMEEELRSFNQRATNTKQAIYLFNVLMTRRSRRLQDYIFEFFSISELLERDDKKVKSMGIAGGTTGAVGGVAAVVGIALAPVTMGASLVATAVGVGMVGAAGGMGVHASRPNKKIGDRKIIEKVICNYMLDVVDIERCVNFILSEITELQRHDLVRLRLAGAQHDALTLAYKSRSMINDFRNCTNALYTSGMSSERLLHTFAAEMDQYFKEKGGQKKLRKSIKSRLSGRVQLLARNLQDELDHLVFVWKRVVN